MTKLYYKSNGRTFMAEGDDRMALDAFIAFMKNKSDAKIKSQKLAEVSEKTATKFAGNILIHRSTEVETTWGEIAAAAAEGNLSEVLKSGDYIPFTLKNGDEVGLDIGRDESGRTYFIFHNSMKCIHPMNSECTNDGGWRNSDMRRYANEEVFNLIPDEVRAIIKPTTIVQVLGGERIESLDNLFCLSATQVFGKRECWIRREPKDTQIDIFRDPHTRSKVWLSANDGSASWWWLRSAYNTNDFSAVSSDGSYGISSANSLGTVALAFCIE